jgi:multidrug efflux pump subunit AcrB
MSLTQFAVRYRPVTYVLLASIMALGMMAIFTLSRREDPDLQGRFVQIIALYPGATAQQVEELVTDKLERTLLELDDIKTVRSTSRPGIAVLQAECSDQEHDIKKFRDDLRNRVSDARPGLPSGVLSVDVNDRFADTAALIVGVTLEGATDRQREDVARLVRDRLRRLPDVAQVDLVGEQQERVFITLSPQRMAQLAVTPTQVAQAIAQRNVLPASGGTLALGSVRFSIQPTGNINAADELAGLVTASPNGVPVYLRDIATITRGYADPSPFLFRVDGKPAVGVAVTMRKGFNITALGDEVKRQFATLEPELPTGARLTLINDLPRSVEGRIAEFNENLLTGVLLIVAVLYLFMGMRSALIVGAMLPITVLGTFALMYLFGRDIQQISIAALIIALGLVVDNSIVVIDNIERKLSRAGAPSPADASHPYPSEEQPSPAEGGLSRAEREQAAIEAVDELRVPLLTSNLTTVASFAPLLLLSGGVGEFIRDLGVVTSLATLISLLFNYTIAPLIAIRFLKGAHEERPNALRRLFLAAVDRLRDGISWLAARGLRRARLTVTLAAVGLAAACAAIPRLGVQFFPSAVRTQFTIDVFLPEGRDVLATLHTAARVERIVRAQSGIVSVATYVGQGGPRFYYNVSPEPPTPNYAQVVVNIRDAAQTHDLIQAIQKQADATISEARVTVRSLEQGPPVGAPVAIRISGDSIAELREAGEQIKTILNATPGATSVYQDYDETPLTLQVKVNEDQARLAGLSNADIAQATQMGFSGLTASYLREGDKEIPIQLRFPAAERSGPQSLADMYLPAAGDGQAVPLRQVATLSLVPQEGRIVRRNHVRTLTVCAFTDGTRLSSQVLADAQQRIARLNLPHGITVDYGGEQEEVGRSFTELLLILGLTFAANLVVVVWEFNSFRAAWTVLAAVPFSMIGAVLGLWVMHLPFGFMAFLGIVSLSGVVTNHAIVLFEYALAELKEGVTMDRALLDAGRRRLRPILLTVLLSIFGVLPQGLNGGTLWPPLAWSLIFGLLMSLLLTLVIVPSFYKVLGGRAERRLKENPTPESESGMVTLAL